MIDFSTITTLEILSTVFVSAGLYTACEMIYNDRKRKRINKSQATREK